VWPELRVWLRAGAAFWVQSWYRRGGRWEVKAVVVPAEDLAAVVTQAPHRRGRKPIPKDLFAPTKGER
jgi:hypothetical protein